jgi:hypothetical protein
VLEEIIDALHFQEPAQECPVGLAVLDADLALRIALGEREAEAALLDPGRCQGLLEDLGHGLPLEDASCFLVIDGTFLFDV